MEVESTDHPQRGFASFILRILWRWLPVLGFLLVALGSPAFEVFATQIKVEIDFPADGSRFAKPAPRAIIAGRAHVSGPLAPWLDLAIVIDRSGSTAAFSGANIEEDETVGEPGRRFSLSWLQALLQSWSRTPRDSVLAAELAGTRSLLNFLDPARTRVSVISFGEDPPSWERDYPQRGYGGYPRMSNARTEQSLTADYEEVREVLTRIRARGPLGCTNMAAAVRAASLARRADIEIHTYALGPQGVAAPFILTEIARITGGRFNPISDPSQIVYRLKDFIFAQLKSLVVENATLNQPAEQVALGPEGAYIAVVPVKIGVNQIEVTGIASDGTQGGASVLLNYLPGGERDSVLQPARREMALSPGIKSFEELQLELEKEKNRWLELNRKTKELELKAQEKELELRAREKDKSREQLELDLEVR